MATVGVAHAAGVPGARQVVRSPVVRALDEDDAVARTAQVDDETLAGDLAVRRRWEANRMHRCCGCHDNRTLRYLILSSHIETQKTWTTSGIYVTKFLCQN